MNNTQSPLKIIILLVVVLLGGYWFYSKSGTTKDAGELVSRVSSKVLVSSDVTPKLVTLTTLEQLRGQNFFKQAALGDVIVMYPDSVILYRPSIDNVSTIGTVDPTVAAQLFNTDQATQLPTAPGVAATAAPVATTDATVPGTTVPASSTDATVTVTPVATPVGVEIRNGTATSGLAKKLSAKLTADTSVTVPVTGNAGNTSYAKTTVVNMTGTPLPVSITNVIKGAEVVTALPAGEKALDANAKVLVIIGADITSKVDGL